MGWGLGGKIRLDTKVQGPSMIGKRREFAESGERKEIDQLAGKTFRFPFFFSFLGVVVVVVVVVRDGEERIGSC